MVRGKIKWSYNAKKDRDDILEFWREKNGNFKYSRKLDKEFRQIITLLKQYVYLGKQMTSGNVRYLVKGEFIIYYDIHDDYIEILHIWDNRRNPDDLKL